MNKTVTHGVLTASSVSLHLKLEDGEATVIDEDFPESYTQADGLTVAVRDAILKKMQKAIDNYKLIAAEKAKQGYIDAPATVNSQLIL